MNFDRDAFCSSVRASEEFMEYVAILAHSLKGRMGAPEVIATAISPGVEIGMALAGERKGFDTMSDFWVQRIVSHRDKKPYIQLSHEKRMIVQLTMGEARNIAMDILQLAARCEADSLLLRFPESMGSGGRGVAGEMMVAFRDCRAQIDEEKVERSQGSDAYEGGADAGLENCYRRPLWFAVQLAIQIQINRLRSKQMRH
jgi:hypothetical protein